MDIPEHLSKEAQKWWSKIMSSYQIDDEAGQLILQTGLEAFDRMKQAQAILDKEGLTQKDRFGQSKSHPLAVIERDSRSQFLMALKQLNLDLEPLRDIGRPSGKGR